MLADHLFEDVPDLGPLLLDHALGGLDGAGKAVELELRIDEGLEQLERHLLRQAALMELELGPDDDDRAAGIIDALAEEVLAEAALLALEHVGERLQRPLVGAGDDAAAPSVVEERVNRLLQHALLVAHDDVGRAQLDETLQPVVAVDDAAIEVVQVGGGETSAIQRHERTQLGRYDGNDLEDHPFRPAVRLQERFDQLQALHELLAARVGARGMEFVAKLLLLVVEIDGGQHPLQRLGADRGGEGFVAVLLLRLDEFLLVQELMQLQGRQARLDHDVALEIEDLLEILERHVEQQADAARQRLQEPDMRHRRGEFDVAHAVAAHLRQGHFDAALLADDAAILHALVLAAQALVVLDRTEDAGAEQTVALRLEGAVVDGLGLLDLTIGPGPDPLRARDRDLDLIEALRTRHLTEDVHQLVHEPSLSGSRTTRRRRRPQINQ